MAQPSSTHRDRERSSSHHHHRTISSTTLLLVLSLILAVLAVMLSIPRASPSVAADATPSGILGLFSPKRNQHVLTREAAVAQRESDVAKREADLLAGIPAGVTIGTCLPFTVTQTAYAVPTEGPVTIIKEVVKEMETLSPPWWKDSNLRVEDVLEREARVSEREKEVGRREEVVGKRESDATRREAWIMEHLMEQPQIAETTEEYIYEGGPPPPVRRPAPKELPLPPRFAPPPPVHTIVTETKTIIQSHSFQTETVPVPKPSPTGTRIAAEPSPEITRTQEEPGIKTTAIEFVVDEVVEDEELEPVHARTVTVVHHGRARPTPPPHRWLGGW
ncbi:hypothetical protein AURDEDRAFT_185113 [Auricularia subglabra TFB-10046 SS5]|nr:hypothetical protein AURDEDRAFT_185113 [Auricularia subglabra TFB-10046 SS5]